MASNESLVRLNEAYVYKLHDLFRQFCKIRRNTRCKPKHVGVSKLRPVMEKIAKLLGPCLTPSIDLNIFAVPDYKLGKIIHPKPGDDAKVPMEHALLVTHCLQLKSPAILQMLASVPTVTFDSIKCFMAADDSPDPVHVGNPCDFILAQHSDEQEDDIDSKMRLAFVLTRGLNHLLERVSMFHITYHENKHTRYFTIVAKDEYAALIEKQGYSVISFFDADVALPRPQASHIRLVAKNEDTDAKVAELAKLICTSSLAHSSRGQDKPGKNASQSHSNK